MKGPRYTQAMAETWKSVPARELKAGDTIRLHGQVLHLARVEPSFLGRQGMLGLIEDNTERWFKGVSSEDADVEVLVQES